MDRCSHRPTHRCKWTMKASYTYDTQNTHMIKTQLSILHCYWTLIWTLEKLLEEWKLLPRCELSHCHTDGQPEVKKRYEAITDCFPWYSCIRLRWVRCCFRNWSSCFCRQLCSWHVTTNVCASASFNSLPFLRAYNSKKTTSTSLYDDISIACNKQPRPTHTCTC